MSKINSDNEQNLCTVVFHLKQGKADVGRFIYALACGVERWKHIEILSLKVGDHQFINTPTDKHTPGADHDQ